MRAASLLFPGQGAQVPGMGPVNPVGLQAVLVLFTPAQVHRHLLIAILIRVKLYGIVFLLVGQTGRALNLDLGIAGNLLVPVAVGKGDLPLIGAAFRGKSKAVQKKNLLVFITGNLMSRGGSTAISTFKGTSPAEIYSNPTFMSSAGVLYRESTRPAEENNAGANAASAAETPSSAGSL